MHNWKLVNLENLGQIITGKTPSTKEKNNFGNKYLFITPRDMLGQKYIHSTERYLSEIGKDRVKNSIIPKNTISVSCIGSDMGKVAMTTQTSITNQQINSIVVNNSCDADFLYYAIINISDEIKNIAHHGTTMPIINKFQFSKLELRLPPLSEQKAIADALSCLDDKIELNNQINKKLEEMAQAIFKSWFVDFEPFKDGEFIDSELGMIPKGWKVGKIEDICYQISSGGTPSTKISSYYDGEINWFSTKELNDKFLIKSEKKINMEAISNSSAKIFPPFTILMAIYASPTVGRLGILTEKSAFNQAAVGLIANDDKICMEYLYLLLLNERLNLNNLANGAAQQNLNVSLVKNYKIICPDKEDLIKFKRIIRPLFKIIMNNAIEIVKLNKIREILLPKLMSGEIRVPFEEAQ